MNRTALCLVLAIAVSSVGTSACSKRDKDARLKSLTILDRIDGYVESANEHALANEFFESLREAQYGWQLAEEFHNEKKRILDMARAQARKKDPSERADMSRYDMEQVLSDYEKAREHVGYFRTKTDFTLVRMVESLAADDEDLRWSARASWEKFCSFDHPAFAGFRAELMVENKPLIEKVAYANPGEVSKMIYDCYREHEL